MENILNLLKEKRNLEAEINNISLTVRSINSKIEDFKVEIHNLFLKNDLYSYIIYDNNPIERYFRGSFVEDELPYSYGGEGDYQEIDFTISEKEVKFFYTETWGVYNHYLFSFPIELVNDSDALIEYVLSKQTDKLNSLLDKEKAERENTIKVLEKRLKELKSK